MPKENKASQAEFNNRVDIIYELLIKGAKRRHILQYVTGKTDWKINERMVDHYIHEANKRLIEQSSKDREAVFGIQAERLEKQYRETEDNKDYRHQLSVIREISNLYGLSVLNINMKLNKTEFDLFLESVDVDSLKKLVNTD